MGRLRLGILASGTGSNFGAIVGSIESGYLEADVRVLVCNRPQAAVLRKAEDRGIKSVIIEHSNYATREEFDAAVRDNLQQNDTDLVVMAGFDRIITPVLLDAFPDKVLNIHPALLPAFKGASAQKQAADYGVTVAGASVHIVDGQIDHGPIVVQAAVPAIPGEGEKALRERIIEQEHRIYPFAIKLFAEGRVRLVGRRIEIDGYEHTPQDVVISPPLDV